MKKNMFLWSLLLISAIGCSNVTLPDDSTNESTDGSTDTPVVDPGVNPGNNPPLTFAVISDVHIGNDVAEGPMVKVPQALKNITSYGELDAMVVVGDLTDHGEVAEYEQFVETFTDSTLFTNPVNDLLFVMGNHDNYHSNGHAHYQDGLKHFNNGEPYPLHHYKVIKGYPFIMVSTLNGCNNDIDSRADGTNAYPPATVTWIEQAMERATQECPGKPIFFFTHIPPRWTCYSTWIEYENGLGWCMQALNRVLNEYPQTIVFAGHSHYPVGDPRSIHQGANPNSAHKNYYTVINTGSTTYAEIHPKAVDGIESGIHPEKFDYVTEGLIVTELPNGDIEVRRYDTYRNEEIAADKRWVIKAPFDGSNFTYTDIRDKNDNPSNLKLYSGGECPEFASDAELKLAVSATTMKVTFPQATDDDCVFRYLVNVYNVASGAIEGKAAIFSRFYLNSEMPEQFIHNFGGLQSETNYRVEVKALDSYDNESKPLVATFTTR
jgi:3',5'-cyclic AMP phosphodiesterase CpdA